MNIKEEPREVPYIATVPPEALDLVIESDEEITKRKIREYIKERYKVEPFHIAVHQLFVWLTKRSKQ